MIATPDPVQDRFAAALRDPSAPVPPELFAVTGDVPKARFDVYRNNVMVSLSQALASRFPAAVAIVGEEFFLAMARVFVAQTPPTSPILMHYGDDFPDFVAAFEPAASVPYLPDVLRLEVARGNAYHAADADPVGIDALAALPPETLAERHITVHPSFALVRSHHPVVTIWSMNAGILPLAPIAEWQGEDALVIRPQLTVLVHRLPPGGHVFLASLAAGSTLGEAVTAALEAAPNFDAGQALAGLITAGVATAIN